MVREDEPDLAFADGVTARVRRRTAAQTADSTGNEVITATKSLNYMRLVRLQLVGYSRSRHNRMLSNALILSPFSSYCAEMSMALQRIFLRPNKSTCSSNFFAFNPVSRSSSCNSDSDTR